MTRTALRFLLLLVALLPAGTVAAETRAVVHYQKNMLFSADTEWRLAGDIRARAPDTVSLQEVSPNNTKILGFLAADYPSQHYCRFKQIGGVAVLSRWPMVEGSGRCLEGSGITAIQVRFPEGKAWVMSVHLETKDKPLHRTMVQALAPELAGYDGPVIMAGDFNDFPGSAALGRLAQAARVVALGPRVTTYRVGGFFPITIDHVLVTGGRGRIEQLPLIGSDHYGLLARFLLEF